MECRPRTGVCPYLEAALPINLNVEAAMTRARSNLGLLVTQIFIASLLMALMGRLFYLQIAEGPRYQQAAADVQKIGRAHV